MKLITEAIICSGAVGSLLNGHFTWKQSYGRAPPSMLAGKVYSTGHSAEQTFCKTIFYTVIYV